MKTLFLPVVIAVAALSSTVACAQESMPQHRSWCCLPPAGRGVVINVMRPRFEFSIRIRIGRGAPAPLIMMPSCANVPDDNPVPPPPPPRDEVVGCRRGWRPSMSRARTR